MTFFLIVPSVIIVSVVLIHGLLNKLGLKIHYIALIICVVLSILSDVGAIFLSPAPDKFYFMRLGGFILVSALVGTAANYFLVKREIQAEEEFAEEVRNAYQEETELTVVEKTESAEKIFEKPVVKVEIKSAEKVQPVKKVDLVKKPRPAEKIQPVKKIESVKVEKPLKIEEEKILEHTAEGKAVKKFEPEKISRPVKKVETAEKIVENKPIEKVEETFLPAETLDDILDRAYLEKSKGNTWQAIAAYKKALEKYRSDEYAPFVAIDLGNIYKEQAMYAKAIKIYEDALELPAVKRNFSTTANFKKNIVYLKSVQSVLLRHKALTTPFSKISKIYLQEIESEFQSAQLK